MQLYKGLGFTGTAKILHLGASTTTILKTKLLNKLASAVTQQLANIRKAQIITDRNHHGMTERSKDTKQARDTERKGREGR